MWQRLSKYHDKSRAQGHCLTLPPTMSWQGSTFLQNPGVVSGTYRLQTKPIWQGGRYT